MARMLWHTRLSRPNFVEAFSQTRVVLGRVHLFILFRGFIAFALIIVLPSIVASSLMKSSLLVCLP